MACDGTPRETAHEMEHDVGVDIAVGLWREPCASMLGSGESDSDGLSGE